MGGSSSTDGRLETGFDDGLVDPGFLVDLLRGGGAPNTKFDNVAARCCFEDRASPPCRFSRSDPDDLSCSWSDSLGRDLVDFDRTAAEGDRSRVASFSFFLSFSFSLSSFFSSLAFSFGGSASSDTLLSFLLDFFGGGAAPQKPQPELLVVRSTRGRSFLEDLVGSGSAGSGGGVGGAPSSAAASASGSGSGSGAGGSSGAGGGVGSLAAAAAAFSA